MPTAIHAFFAGAMGAAPLTGYFLPGVATLPALALAAAAGLLAAVVSRSRP